MNDGGLSPLHAEGSRIVDATGRTVRLRGVALGGWMNMENFINGYPGVEHSLRGAVADTLGPERARFFFDRWLDHVLAEDDIAFLAGIGANVVRLALNYRHFETDDRPFTYREEGFVRLERAIEWCARHSVYAILDLHAAQGWQNPDWHSDNRHKHALLWDHPHFQDRFVALWEELARRFRGNATVAAYDLVNEPATHDVYGGPRWDRINSLYRRVVEAIRRIDEDHIIVLEGDTFGSRFEGLEPPFTPNVAYSMHDYSVATFGPGPYPGEIRGKYRDREQVRETFMNTQGMRYAREYGVPMWVGEFGAVYNGPPQEVPDRARALDDQLAAFEEGGAHWTIWTYKDVGVMGVVTLDPESPYLELVDPDIRVKLELASDAWMQWLPRRAVHDRVESLAAFLHHCAPDVQVTQTAMEDYIKDIVLSGYMGTLLQPEWASRFAGMTDEQIDDVLGSFALARCRPNETLVGTLQRHMEIPG